MFLNNLMFKIVPRQYHILLRYFGRKACGTLEKEVSLLRDLVGKGETAIDVGANYGVYSYVLSKLCRKVEAFEPNPNCAKEIEAFNAGNITVHNVGLSSFRAFLELHIPIMNGFVATESATFSKLTGDQETIRVPVHALDDYNFTGVSFLKIDVEGHEIEVLKGAESTIEREHPTILVEIEQRHLDCPISSVFEKILEYGYRGFYYKANEMRPLSEFDYEIHQQPYLHNVMHKDYIHNFIFKAK